MIFMRLGFLMFQLVEGLESGERAPLSTRVEHGLLPGRDEIGMEQRKAASLSES